VDCKDVREFASFNLVVGRPVVLEQLFETLNCEEGLQPRILVRVTHEEPYVGVVR